MMVVKREKVVVILLISGEYGCTYLCCRCDCLLRVVEALISSGWRKTEKSVANDLGGSCNVEPKMP